MSKSSRRLTAVTIVSGVATAALAFGAPAIAASAAPASDGHHVTTIGQTTVSTRTLITNEDQLTAFEKSATPKVITIDPTTNTVQSVTETTKTAQLDGISNPCESGALCWSAAKTPYANFGFSGAGTYNGSWPWRGTMDSNNWGGQLTYTINNSGASSTTDPFGHNSEITFDRSTVNNVRGLKVVVTS
uniref:hypothetical protein n=1 Tax=Clavibacter sp. VKM Ac-2872 TaxID=2783812 RepID=UPI00188BA41F|nr:hypothetical protein [Clavibacter sp. VKM Ac-2872]MBF4625776.1 hypothetical protein [Clavibacter sp. VKM Ac-2872]